MGGELPTAITVRIVPDCCAEVVVNATSSSTSVTHDLRDDGTMVMGTPPGWALPHHYLAANPALNTGWSPGF
ncbi:hypothetical protein CHLRE_16g660651v5 [Chlamydomonas reinhardtii]|uniref:Uncharacterized protein n=1 Tax=Chlamydomonas reinhardtii TaxID=3055 RepID=A0A2K3CTK7_CHLRE|nr:uncharacterized protein CHLRE_16g660651v5 [Chlamydomonas reinhardtii]PNW71591.1 hypothetical protein CHLRE_16g660651v5 [Chlamydomonas reinhardtii]